MKIGNMFIMEHPASASSWTTDEMKSLTSMKGATCLVLDQCMYGLGSEDRERSGASKKDDKDCHKLVGSRTSVEYEM